MLSSIEVELVIDLQADLGEGAIWNPVTQRLNFVDITGRRVYEYDPVTRARRAIGTPERVGTVVPRREGGLVVALAGGLSIVDAGFRTVRFLITPAEHVPALCRFNDGKCDPQGRLWAGTLSLTQERGAGSLYCFAPGAQPRQALTGVSISNGLAWSLDGSVFYYIDSPTRKVDAFAFDGQTGSLSDRRTVITLPPGPDVPDGCTLDAEGKLWIAHWDGGKVTRWDPSSGECLATVPVPAPQVTSCAFGGDKLETLYITTARGGMSPAQVAAAPQAGGIFSCRPGVAGIPASCFGG